MFKIFRLSVPVALPMMVVFLLLSTNVQAQSKYRLLVVITPAAYGVYGSATRTTINNNVISSTNVRYTKSGINGSVELAGIVRVNYIESESIRKDIDSLRTWGNNPANIVSILRALYSADLVTMIEDNQDNYGGIGNTPSIPSPLYAYTCLSHDAVNASPYVAAHEFGHNHRCLDDTVVNPGNTPVMYGHGFRMPNGIDGDVMSYAPIHQPWFSSPDSLYPAKTGTPRGTELRCNAALVHRENMPFVANYSSPQNNVTVSNRTWKASEYGDVMATDSIVTSGTDSLKDSSEVKLRAIKKVVINSGFYVARNGNLTISTGSTVLAKRRPGDSGGTQQPSSSAKVVDAFSAKVSMAGKSIRVNLSMPISSPVTISIVDLSGRLLLHESMIEQNAGQHEYLLGLREKNAADGDMALQCRYLKNL